MSQSTNPTHDHTAAPTTRAERLANTIEDLRSRSRYVLDIATQGDWAFRMQWNDDNESAAQEAANAIRNTPDGTVLFYVDVEGVDDRIVCLTGNGPNSQMNAMAISKMPALIREYRELAAQLVDEIDRLHTAATIADEALYGEGRS